MELAIPGTVQSFFLGKRQKESQLRSRKLDTTALRSPDRVMLKPHELHILLFMSSGSSEGEMSQREVLHYVYIKN